MSWNDQTVRTLLRQMSAAAVESAAPFAAVLRNLPPKLAARCVVIGAGRARPAMAAALDTAWLHVDVSGMEVTRHGHAVPDLKRLRRLAERIGTRHDIQLPPSP